MPDPIEPALTPALSAEEWRDGEFDSHYARARTSFQIDHKGRVFALSEMDGESEIVILNESHDYGALVKMIALANAALPDDHPAKITRQRIAAFREVLAEYVFPGMDGLHAEEWRIATQAKALLAALASYLPPEGP